MPTKADANETVSEVVTDTVELTEVPETTGNGAPESVESIPDAGLPEAQSPEEDAPVEEASDLSEAAAEASELETPSPEEGTPEPVGAVQETDEPEAMIAGAEVAAEGATEPAEAVQATDELELSEADAPAAEASEAVEAPADEDTGSPEQFFGYTGKIEGPVFTLEDLEPKDEAKKQEELDQAALEELIVGSVPEVKPDEIVTAQVITVSNKEVIVDFGFKSDGVISKSEFIGDVAVGDEVEVFLERFENYHGQPEVSKVKADKVRRWQTVVSAFEHGSVLEGTIIRRIKGGMIVDLLEGLEAFLPGSQIDVRPVRDFDAYLERRMEFKVVKINESNENVVVSHKALIEKELAAQRRQILDTMESGQILEGVVKNITDFGVFVDLGGVDGLLHITDLSWGRIAHPSEVVDLDQDLKVVVLDYDKERQRISLGLKQLLPHPWEEVSKRLTPGDTVEGKVVSITDYGAFVEIEKGIEGLVHISEMSWTDHIRHPSQKVSLGQVVKVVVLGLEHDSKKVSLGMKQFEPNPWEGIAVRYAPGTVLKGTVRNITNFGVFVEIEPGIDGLVHISDLSWTKKIRHPGELVRKRQELSVVVLDVDESRRRISLGHKQIETNPWTGLAAVYEEGSDHSGKILRVTAGGIAVELPLEVEAFVPAKELEHGDRSIFTAYREGDELVLRVIRMDVNAKEIIMSEIARARQEQRKQRAEEERAKRSERQREEREVRRYTRRTQSSSGPTTLGELSGLEGLRSRMKAQERAAKRAEKRDKKKASAPADEVSEPTEVAPAAAEAPHEEPAAPVDTVAAQAEAAPATVDSITEDGAAATEDGTEETDAAPAAEGTADEAATVEVEEPAGAEGADEAEQAPAAEEDGADNEAATVEVEEPAGAEGADEAEPAPATEADGSEDEAEAAPSATKKSKTK